MSVWYDRDDPANNDPPDYDDEVEPSELSELSWAEAQRQADEWIVALPYLPADKRELWRAAYATIGMNLDVMIVEAKARLAR